MSARGFPARVEGVRITPSVMAQLIPMYGREDFIRGVGCSGEVAGNIFFLLSMGHMGSIHQDGYKYI